MEVVIMVFFSVGIYGRKKGASFEEPLFHLFLAPGQMLPWRDNFSEFSYKWIPYVTNNKFFEIMPIMIDWVGGWKRKRGSDGGKAYDKMDGRRNSLVHISRSSWHSMIPIGM
jgi:hypothetical protein